MVGAIGIIGIAVALVAIFWGLWLSLSRAPGRRTGSPGIMLNGMFYLVAGALYFGLCYVLWRPLPIDLGLWLRLFVLALGSALLFSGLILVTWGRFALGRMYNVSSGFGVQLYEDQRLVTEGPFAIVRHPMYLGILFVALGGYSFIGSGRSPSCLGTSRGLSGARGSRRRPSPWSSVSCGMSTSNASPH